MMKTKWSPGPWTVDGEGIRAIVRAADITIVAVRHRLPKETHVANMRLTAAAPELYEALADARCVLNAMLSRGDESALQLIRKVEAALAKADGASS